MSTQETKFEFFELGDKTSLICADPALSQIAKTSLKELGFKCHIAETSEVAIERISYTTYDCVVIQENFAGSSLRSNAVLNYLSPLPMTLRRNSFVCVIGPSFKTLDAMQAYAQSVHVAINPDDLSNMTPILKKSMAEFKRLYESYDRRKNAGDARMIP